MDFQILGFPALIWRLEAGGLEFTDIAQETCTGSVIGDEYWELETTHLKYFGGTSNHWTGVCRPLDEIDFEKRSDISGHIGWPISKSDLDPYFEEAKTILEVAQLREAPINQYIKE
jgi:choline dehydrogenase-like flavoprotein